MISVTYKIIRVYFFYGSENSLLSRNFLISRVILKALKNNVKDAQQKKDEMYTLIMDRKTHREENKKEN